MAGTVGVGDFKEVLLFLGTAGVVVPLFRRVRISPVIGFIAAGVALGPFGLGRLVKDYSWLGWISFADVEEMRNFSELGVVFLLFMIGLELSFERLSSMRRLVFGLGAAQVIVSSAVLAGLAMWLGQPAAASVIIGSAVARLPRPS